MCCHLWCNQNLTPSKREIRLLRELVFLPIQCYLAAAIKLPKRKNY